MPSIIKKLYLLVIKYRDKKAIPIVDITLIFPWLNFHSLYYAENPNDTSLINGYLDKVESIKERVVEVGGDLIVKKKELPITTIEEIVQKIEKTANEKLRNSLVFSHHFEMIIEYMDKLNKEEALFHANLSYRYNSNLEPFMYNNIGYVFMSVGDCDKARRILEKSIKNYQESYKSALPNYNLGILEAKCSNFNEALVKINFCIDEIRDVSKKERECGCLFIPRIENGELKYEEVRKNPDLLEIAVEAKKNLEIFLNNEA
jgi:tetratricopeptide (TPR) repeat protein